MRPIFIPNLLRNTLKAAAVTGGHRKICGVFLRTWWRTSAPFALLFLTLSCAHNEKPAPVKHYPLTGKVVSVNAKEQTAAVDAAAIKNFMEAMTMDYPIQSKDEFATLHAGDHITATVDVSDDGSYTLSHIKIVPPTGARAPAQK